MKASKWKKRIFNKLPFATSFWVLPSRLTPLYAFNMQDWNMQGGGVQYSARYECGTDETYRFHVHLTQRKRPTSQLLITLSSPIFIKLSLTCGTISIFRVSSSRSQGLRWQGDDAIKCGITLRRASCFHTTQNEADLCIRRRLFICIVCSIL